jgi:hypothetical protein
MMLSLKSFILLIISIMSMHGLIGQTYIPLAVEGAHWIIRYDKIETIEPVDDLWEYHIAGDTTLNEVGFKKVYRRDLVVTQDGPPFEAEGPYQLYGLIRDDTTHRKVYAIKYNEFEGCPENQEYLLYDFSLDIGDTLELCIIPDWDIFTVNDVYSQEVLGFNTRVFAGWDELYEGMGSYYGLFEEMFAPVKKSLERYVYHTFLAYYCRESPCLLFVSTGETRANENIKLFPNPAKHYLSVSTSDRIQSIQVYNNLGQIVKRVEGNVRKVNVEMLPPGSYLVEIVMKNKIVTKKVIIE